MNESDITPAEKAEAYLSWHNCDGSEVEWYDSYTKSWKPLIQGHIARRVVLRLKPEIKWRPWASKDVPLGAWFDMWTTDHSKPSLVVCVEGGGIGTVGLKEVHFHSFNECLADGWYSTDQGKTWQQCGVLE